MLMLASTFGLNKWPQQLEKIIGSQPVPSSTRKGGHR